MNREQGAFLLGGMVFGLVAGLLLGFAFFKPGVFGNSGAAPVMRGGGAPAPATGGMDPGGVAMMEAVTTEIETLKKQVAANPQDFAALVRLGDLFFDVSKFDEARGFYEQAVAANPHDPKARTSLGVCYLQMGDPARALESCQEAFRHAPDYWPAALYTAIVAMELGDAGIAEEALARLKELNPAFEHLADLESSLARMKDGHATIEG